MSFPALPTVLILLVFAFPTVGLFMKHAMSAIALSMSAILMLAAVRAGDGKTLLPSKSALWPTALLLVLAGASLLWSGSCERCGPQWGEKFGAAFLLVPLAAACLYKAEIVAAEKLMKGLLLGVALTFVMLWVEGTFDAPLHRILSGKGFEVNVDPSRFNRPAVALCLLLFPLGAWLALGRMEIVGFALIGLGLLITLFGQALAAPVALLAGLAVLIPAFWVPKLMARAMAAAVVLFSLSVPWLGQGIGQYSETVEQAVARSVAHRLEIWEHGAEALEGHLIAGHGFASYRNLAVSEVQRDRFRIMTKVDSHPHNGPLQLWLELGLLGVLPFLALYVVAVEACLRFPARQVPWALGGVAAATVPLMVSFGLWQVTWLSMLAMVAFFFLLARSQFNPDIHA